MEPRGCSTPIFSASPALQRKCKLHFTEKTEELDSKEAGETYYPNCDVNVWLRSCERELPNPLTGVATGTIPNWLQGTLIRNGPGSLKVGNQQFSHLFDSSALLHRFHVENGSVTYQCRFLQSEVYKRNQAANRIVLSEFGTAVAPDPCRTIFQKVAAFFQPKSDNNMISVYPIGDAMYAMGETPNIHKINAKTLETEAKVAVNEHVAIVHHTSHPHVMKNGTVFNLGLSVSPTGPKHTIVEFPPEKPFENGKIIAGVACRWPLHPSYMHTFGITENFFIIVEQPMSVSIPAMLTTRLKNEPMAGCFRWYQEEKVIKTLIQPYSVQTQFTLLSRKTGLFAYKFQTDSFFYLHIINQYESDDSVIIDICIYRDPAMLDCMYIETMKSMQSNKNYAKMFRSKPVRFVLPLTPKIDGSTVHVKPEKLCDLGCETPRINYEFLGKPYRFFYAISADVDADNPGTIIKVDTRTRQVKTWCEVNCYPSEPIFVARPNPIFEDDGVVLAALVWGRCDTNRTGLLVLDAVTFTEMGRVEFNTPGPVPKCLHGWFLQN